MKRNINLEFTCANLIDSKYTVLVLYIYTVLVPLQGYWETCFGTPEQIPHIFSPSSAPGGPHSVTKNIWSLNISLFQPLMSLNFGCKV